MTWFRASSNDSAGAGATCGSARYIVEPVATLCGKGEYENTRLRPRLAARPKPSRVRESLTPGKDRRLRAVRHLQLAQDVVDMALDCALADDQPLGNLGIGQPIGNQAQHLTLALAQCGIEQARLLRGAVQLLHQPRRDMGMQYRLAPGRLPNGLRQLLQPHAFDQVRDRARADR